MTARAGRWTFHLIPHTHWDREWYLPRAGFQARLVPVLEAALDQLERDPTARFVLDGQTVLVEDYLAANPHDATRIERGARRGALELGPWYVLADELIPAGESLLRNLLEGARDAERFGGRMDVLYSPDAFGHPAILPTLAGEFGLRFGVLWRGVGRPRGSDFDLYRWAGPDGHGLLLYHLPRDGYSVGAGLATAGLALETRWPSLRDELTARAGTRHVAVFVGADHHAAPERLSELRDRLQALEPHAAIRVSGLADYFEAVERSTATLVTVEGELRRIDGHTWVLQGVHGTRARMKRRHARAELALQRLAEPLAALAALHRGRDRRGVLRLAWRTLIQSQFHDTLGGCCADGVVLEQDARLQTVESLSREIAAAALADLSGDDPDRAREAPAEASPRLVLWNPLARPRTGIVTAELTFFRRDVPVGPPSGAPVRTGDGSEPFVLRSSTGAVIVPQVIAVRPGLERLDATRHYPDQDEVDRVFVAFQAPDLDGLGMNALSLEAGAGPPGPRGVIARAGRLRNSQADVRVSRTGALSLRRPGGGLTWSGIGALVSEPDAGDTYTFCRGTGPDAQQRGTRTRVLVPGPLVGALETTSRLATIRGALRIRRVIALHADSPTVRLRYDIENGALDHRLRVRFPTHGGRSALAGAAFGSEARPPVTDGAGGIEHHVRTAPAHRYVFAGGLAVLAPGFFEYEWTADGDILVTLVRSVGELSRDDLPARPGHAGWPQPTPLAQEQGPHTIELAVVPFARAPTPEGLEALWEEVFLPVQAVFRREFAARESPVTDGGVSLEGPGLVFAAAKPAEDGDGIVLRCWNATAGATRGRWVLRHPIAAATRLRGDETDLERLPLDEDARVVAFDAGPRQLVTIRVSS